MEPFEELTALDRLVHEPARLAILTALSACDAADFVFLQSLTGLTQGNLSAHLTKLERAGLVEIEKGFRGKVPQTRVRLTRGGRKGIEGHWDQLQALRKQSIRWRRARRARRIEEPHEA